MVKIVPLLPTIQEITQLGKLQGELRIWHHSHPWATGPSKLYLQDQEAKLISVSIVYEDVIFKFECFGLKIAEESEVLSKDSQEVAVIPSWDAIECLFTYEWERPAKPSDKVPANYVQIVAKRSPRKYISPEATAMGVSMLGIAFLRQKEVVAIIKQDPREPFDLIIKRLPEQMDSYMEDFERVPLKDVPDWLANFEKWQKSHV